MNLLILYMRVREREREVVLYLFNLMTTQGFTINPQMTANLRCKTES